MGRNPPEKQKEYNRRWREKNPDYARHWRKANQERRRQLLQEWRKANPGKVREHVLFGKYGVTKEQYQSLLRRQLFKCASCKTPLSTLQSSERHIDHCHKTGRVRGVLCGPCNRALGLMKDDPIKLRRLAKYISRFS